MSNENKNENETKNIRIIRCLMCRSETSEDQVPPNTMACPSCEAKVLPEYVDQDVDIRINWHELRILYLWANEWEQMAKLHDNGKSITSAIAEQLDKYRPIDGAPLAKITEVEFDLDEPRGSIH